MEGNVFSADILVVDDTPANLSLLTSMLKEDGYKVRPAPSGKLALKAAENSLPDLILLDINMPDMNGYDVCRKFKQNPKIKDVPILFISALSDTFDKLKAFEVGGVDYITKPFQFEEVNARVNTHLSLRRSQLELVDKNKKIIDTLERLKDTQSKLVQSEKMASLGVLTAGISHEINNPINFVLSSGKSVKKIVFNIVDMLREYEKITLENVATQLNKIQYLKEGKDLDGLVEGVTELIENITTGSERISDIVTGLHTFSRLDEERKMITDIEENMNSAIMMLSHECRDGIKVIREFQHPPRLYCYPGKLNQVFVNVLHNAVQAINEKSDKGIIKVKLATESIGNKNHLIIVVNDNGIGIREQDKEKIFQPFFTTKEVGKGIGLGLSISYSIIKEHNGEIYIDNHLDEGTTFKIVLPYINE